MCGRIVQKTHSKRPSFSDYSSFFFSSNTYLKFPIFYCHHLRPCLHSCWLISANLFLLLFIFIFPLSALFPVHLFPLYLSLLSIPHYVIHLHFIPVLPFRPLCLITLQELLALNRKQITVKMWKFPQCETRFCEKSCTSL
jgi:hypothetical protein